MELKKCTVCGGEWRGHGNVCGKCIAQSFEERHKLETEVESNTAKLNALNEIIVELRAIKERLIKLGVNR